VIRRAFAVLAMVLGTVGLAACGNDDVSSAHGEDVSSTKTINITVTGSDVTPNGDRVEVKVGQPVQLVVKADAPGEIHVHSDPEHEFQYSEGTTTLKPFTIDKPGLVAVESHSLDKTIVQLEVK
jgi:hypothetical protein